jgi:outer membrane protein OmpA-like peptidoglycan-associated protein
MTKRALWLAAAMTAMIPFAAQAGDAGWYVGAGAGASLTDDGDVSTGETVESDVGWIGLMRGGYDYGNGWRTEVEASYRDGGVDKVSGNSAGDGDIDSLSGMVNALYEFETGSFFRPYLGVGLGGSYIGFDKVRPINSSQIDDNDMVFAYQGIAGVSFEIDPNVAVFVDYRYLGTDDPDLHTDANTEIEGEYSNHSVVAGLRYKWLKPKPAPEPVPEIVRAKAEPPPPPPAAAEEIPRNFIIFFDWDQDGITPEAQKILQEAAQYAKQANVARIVLTGHADRSGSDQYNEGLSMRRARNAMAELVGLGIPESAIAVFAKGETQPLVATDDGVREPQNRRVEIVLE